MIKTNHFTIVETMEKSAVILVDNPDYSFTVVDMYDWYCSKCGAKVNQMNKPIATSCPKGGSHEWVK
jgi:hypothetical protein